MEVAAQVLEIMMLICFGCSWPISVYKSWKCKTSVGKSSVFNIFIIIGYVAGISSKFFKMDNYMTSNSADPIARAIFIFAIVMYFLNIALVTVNLVLFYIYKARDSKILATVEITADGFEIDSEDTVFDTSNIIVTSESVGVTFDNVTVTIESDSINDVVVGDSDENTSIIINEKE